MAEYRAYFTATASHIVKFEHEADDLRTVAEAAYDAFQGVPLCHYCSGQMTLGDFEIDDEDNDIEKVED